MIPQVPPVVSPSVIKTYMLAVYNKRRRGDNVNSFTIKLSKVNEFEGSRSTLVTSRIF